MWQGTSSTGVDDPKPHGASTRRSDQTKEFPKTDGFLSTDCRLPISLSSTSVPQRDTACTGIPLLPAVSPPSLHECIVGAPYHRRMDKATEKRTMDTTKAFWGLHFCVPRTPFPGCTPSVSGASPPCLPSLIRYPTTRTHDAISMDASRTLQASTVSQTNLRTGGEQSEVRSLSCALQVHCSHFTALQPPTASGHNNASPGQLA